MTNTLAYYNFELVTVVKSFKASTSGGDISSKNRESKSITGLKPIL
jgi:hypothetical protein